MRRREMMPDRGLEQVADAKPQRAEYRFRLAAAEGVKQHSTIVEFANADGSAALRVATRAARDPISRSCLLCSIEAIEQFAGGAHDTLCEPQNCRALFVTIEKREVMQLAPRCAAVSITPLGSLRSRARATQCSR